MSNNSHTSQASTSQVAPKLPPPSLDFEAAVLRKMQTKLAIKEMEKLDAQDKSLGLARNVRRAKARKELKRETALLQCPGPGRTGESSSETCHSGVTQLVEREERTVEPCNDTRENYQIMSVCGTKPESEHVHLYEDIKRSILGVCFSNAIVDKIPPRQPKWDGSQDDLHRIFKYVEADMAVPENKKVDKVLQWHLAMYMWKLIHDLVIARRARIQDPYLACLVVHQSFEYLQDAIRPFVKQTIYHAKFEYMLFSIIMKAKRLGEVLLKHRNASWSFTVPYNMRGKLANQRLPCPWKNGMWMVDLWGSTHQDDASLDMIRWVVFGPMAASVMDDNHQCRLIWIETKPWAIVYRPEKNQKALGL
ncbi:hypothetical protein QQX98_005303 [Neonectria punicea]|uniref:Uncharacterized protein n=1 Tax=Neonectria punicea TaxID=979145 RepID=A0ABR1H645_9HYPO